jgi:hypothetical protein
MLGTPVNKLPCIPLLSPQNFSDTLPDGTTPGVETEDHKMLEAPLIKEASRSEEQIADTAAEVNESAKMVDAE